MTLKYKTLYILNIMQNLSRHVVPHFEVLLYCHALHFQRPQLYHHNNPLTEHAHNKLSLIHI